MKIALTIIFLIAAICWMSEMKLSLKPFSIAFPNWRSTVGIVIIIIGAAIYQDAGRRKGWNSAIDNVMKVMDDYKRNKQK